jgi:hypothetical protein
MDTTLNNPGTDNYTWLIALGVMYLAMMIILCGPQGLVFDAVRGLLTGLALCSGLAYLVLTNVPEEYR